MKRSVAGEIAAAGACGSTEMLMRGWGVVELSPLAMTRVMADEGSEIGKKVTQWADTKKIGLQKVRFRWELVKPSTRRKSKRP